MQIGNAKALSTARNALRDRFDAIWANADAQGQPITKLEVRALRCANALDEPNFQSLTITDVLTA